VLVNYINEYQINHGVLKSQAYDTTMYVLAGLLVVGFVCNLLVRPVAAKWYMTDSELGADRQLSHDASPKPAAAGTATGQGGHRGLVLAAWLLVGIPLVYGIWNTLTKAWVLFQ